jgi:hypothetical protein
MKTNLPQIDIFVVANGGTSGTGGNDVNGGSEQLFFDKNNFFSALFFGFGPALLGVTGFESSTQFIEQQAPGIFPKTLRNMWFCSSLYNMAFACLSLAVVPLEEIYQQKNILLSFMGRRTGGKWLEIFVSIDAFIVLSGAVLTSYIGIIGLVERLAIDRILPRFLIQKNTWRQTNHFIILSYFLIASSLVLILNAKVEPLAGVFGFAFLGVLASFAISCLFLQIFRSQMPRQTKNSWTNCFFCLFSVLTGLVSNMLGDFLALAYSFFYFLLFGMIMVFMFERVSLLKGLLYLSRQIVLWRRQEKVVSDDNDPHYHEKEHEEEEEDKKEEEEHKQQQQTSRNVVHGQRYRCGGCGNSGGDDRKFIGSVMLAKSIERIKRTPIIFLCKLPNLPRVNEAISYVMQNEQTYSLRLVHIVEDQEIGIPLEFEEIVCLFDHIFPSIKIDFVSINGRLEPAMIEWISKLMQIPTNMMFMGQPSHVSTHEIAAMGVRVITG